MAGGVSNTVPSAMRTRANLARVFLLNLFPKLVDLSLVCAVSARSSDERNPLTSFTFVSPQVALVQVFYPVIQSTYGFLFVLAQAWTLALGKPVLNITGLVQAALMNRTHIVLTAARQHALPKPRVDQFAIVTQHACQVRVTVTKMEPIPPAVFSFNLGAYVTAAAHVLCVPSATFAGWLWAAFCLVTWHTRKRESDSK